MESPGKALDGNEVGILEMQSAKGVEVGKEDTDEAKGALLKVSESSAPEQSNLNFSFRVGSPPPEIHVSSRRNSLTRSAFSQPKSRFGEQSVAIDSNILEDSSLEQDFPYGGFLDEVSPMRYLVYTLHVCSFNLFLFVIITYISILYFCALHIRSLFILED